MKVNDELVDKVATLAKLRFEGEEKEAIKKDMERILTFVEQLNKVDTAGVEPLEYMTSHYQELRADISESTIAKEDALKNAPAKDSDYFKVPKVLNKKK